MRAYFGRAKAACLCSYFCNRHLCYDGGRLGRGKIVTLSVGARAKEGKRGGRREKKYPRPLPTPFDSPHFLPSFRVSTVAFASKTFVRRRKTPALQASQGPWASPWPTHRPPCVLPVAYPMGYTH